MPDFGRKGIGLIFPNLDAEIETSVTAVSLCGDANDLGFVGGSPGKSSLFFVRGSLPGIGLAGDRDVADYP